MNLKTALFEPVVDPRCELGGLRPKVGGLQSKVRPIYTLQNAHRCERYAKNAKMPPECSFRARVLKTNANYVQLMLLRRAVQRIGGPLYRPPARAPLFLPPPLNRGPFNHRPQTLPSPVLLRPCFDLMRASGSLKAWYLPLSMAPKLKAPRNYMDTPVGNIGARPLMDL